VTRCPVAVFIVASWRVARRRRLLQDKTMMHRAVQPIMLHCSSDDSRVFPTPTQRREATGRSMVISSSRRHLLVPVSCVGSRNSLTMSSERLRLKLKSLLFDRNLVILSVAADGAISAPTANPGCGTLHPPSGISGAT
jgi:hypothetical protein